MDMSNGNARGQRVGLSGYSSASQSQIQLPITSQRREGYAKSYLTSQVVSCAQSHAQVRYDSNSNSGCRNGYGQYKQSYHNGEDVDDVDDGCDIDDKYTAQHNNNNGIKCPYSSRRVRSMKQILNMHVKSSYRSTMQGNSDQGKSYHKLKSSRKVEGSHEGKHTGGNDKQTNRLIVMNRSNADRDRDRNIDRNIERKNNNNKNNNKINNNNNSNNSNNGQYKQREYQQNVNKNMNKNKNMDTNLMDVNNDMMKRVANNRNDRKYRQAQVQAQQQIRVDTMNSNTGQQGVGEQTRHITNTNSNIDTGANNNNTNINNNNNNINANTNNNQILDRSISTYSNNHHSNTHNSNTHHSHNRMQMQMSKMMQQMMIKNNEYLHRLNQSVVNRLFNIIENQQDMANSRWTNINANTNTNTNNNTNTKQKHRQLTTHKQIQKQKQRQYSSNRSYYKYSSINNTNAPISNTINNTINKNNKLDQQQQLRQSLDNTYKDNSNTKQQSGNQIIINNIIPTSTKSHHTQPTHSIMQRENEIKALEGHRRHRQFRYANNINKINQEHHTNAQSLETPQQTPRTIYNNISNTGLTSVDDTRYQTANQSCQNTMQRHKHSLHEGQIIFEKTVEEDKGHYTELIPEHKVNMKKTTKPTEYHQTNKLIQQISLTNTQQKIQNQTNNGVNSHLLLDVERIQSENSVQLPVTSNSKGNPPVKSNSVQQPFVNSKLTDKQPVYLQIASGDNQNQFKNMSLAEAFKKRIGKLPSKEQRRAQQQLNKPQSHTTEKDMQRSYAIWSQTKVSNSTTKLTKTKNNKQNNKRNQSHTNLQVDVRGLSVKNQQNNLITPKSKQPSQQLLNRLIYGSKVKVSKKQMYALTRKNYENLPEVQEKKKIEQKKQLQQQRIERMKEYQKSIRASKTTIASIN